MSDPGFFARYQQTEQQLQAYVTTLPLWVNVWRGWMFLVFTLSVPFLIHKREARWLALTMVVSVFAYNVVAMKSGVGRFPSIAFVVLWSPLVVYLARRRGQRSAASRLDRIYAWWVDLALATLIVSLAFDVYNVLYSVLTGTP